MIKLNNYLLCFTILAACNSTPTARQYFNRKPINACITAFEPGYMFCNGVKKEIPPRMQITETVEDAEYFIDYFSDKEFRLFMCLNFNECK